MIAILGSGVGLGLHVPGLHLKRRLQQAGVPAELLLYEPLLVDEKFDLIGSMKAEFHRSYRFALAARSMARRFGDRADEAKLVRLLHDWARRGLTRFVILAGFWQPVLRRYVELVGANTPINVDICYIDSRPGLSFLTHGPPLPGWREVYLADARNGAVPWTIPLQRGAPVSWAERNGRIFSHGGGWGLGTYRERAVQLANHGFAVDLLAYAGDDLAEFGCPHRIFQVDPDWQPWYDDSYPPIGQARTGQPIAYRQGDGMPGHLTLLCEATAMMSKPGGGSLLDSLSTATPLILLEPYTTAEASNADLWCRLGLGVRYGEWMAQGYPLAPLAAAHRRLLDIRRQAGDYPADLAARV